MKNIYICTNRNIIIYILIQFTISYEQFVFKLVSLKKTRNKIYHYNQGRILTSLLQYIKYI